MNNLVMRNFMMRKEEQKAEAEDRDWREEFRLDWG